MRRISIDTNVYVAFKSGLPVVVNLFQNADLIGVDITVAAELVTGFTLGNRERIYRQEFSAFLSSSRVELLLHDLETIEFYAHIVRQVKGKGRPIPTNDIWIAGNAFRNGLPLVTFDRHFEEIPGVIGKGESILILGQKAGSKTVNEDFSLSHSATSHDPGEPDPAPGQT